MVISHRLSFEGVMNRKTKQRLGHQRLEGEVHSHFKQTFNIVLNTQFPNMITLGGDVIKNSPNSIVFTDFDPLIRHVAIGDLCVIKDCQLWLGDYAKLNLVEDPANDCAADYLQVELEDRKHYQSLIPIIEACLKRRNPYQSGLDQHPFIRQFHKESTQLTDAIMNENWERVRKHGRRLIGLGLGLTPTGDDYLTGLLLALQLKHKLRETIIEAIFDELLDKSVLHATNLLSQHQLYFALHGEAKPSLLSLIQVCQTPEVENLSSASIQLLVEEVLSIGSTSGYDLLTGVLAALHIMERMECQ